MTATPNDILHFWREAGPKQWFKKSAKFDAAIRLKFEPVHHAAARGEYDAWAGAAEGALALLILLDQFPRNLYRGSAHSYATDPKARAIARAAVGQGFHKEVEAELVPFFFLPFEHSEDPKDQAESVRLCAAHADADTLKWAEIHRDIIDRFGRFPHRNAALGRVTTPDEQAFLDDGGFAG
ncbi:DUF924 family protein [Phenylobacterium soli]|uniref:DUF924 domain-containing protein n=1 Tax=Phenylobacterium soli TaxID=2170551 RepID=A0A328AJ81_9CAUL|nr:DUF924 family protein [Phenylobacterium soli]RAK54567.1 DUF924 domain-containing protein [Phenylobacterium soli]